MRFVLPGPYEVRPFIDEDAEALARHANNRKVWRNLRDAFPHPYRRSDAESFIRHAQTASSDVFLCITADGEAIGGIGLHRRGDIERHTAELGYWLSEDHWGRSVCTEAVKAMTAYAFDTLDLNRVVATPYGWNPASARVLEKAGFVLEGRLRSAVFKDGEFVDYLVYSRLRSDTPTPES